MAVVKGFQRKELIKFGHPVMKLPDKKIYLTNSFYSCANYSPLFLKMQLPKNTIILLVLLVFVGVL